MLTVSYADYAQGGGQLSEAEFAALLPKATADVEYLVGNNEVTDEDAYKRACLAALGAYEDAQLGSGLSIGSFRVSGRRTSKPESAAQQAAYKVLATSGMVYTGLA